MFNLVVAMDENGAIGKDNSLLCKLSDDLKHFKSITDGKMVVMGRKTLESIGKPLPNRMNVVLSTQGISSDYLDKGVIVTSKDTVLSHNHVFPSNEYFVIGGGEIYKEFLPHASKIYLTRIHHKFEDADTFFPELNMEEWEIESETKHLADQNNEYDFTIQVLNWKL